MYVPKQFERYFWVYTIGVFGKYLKRNLRRIIACELNNLSIECKYYIPISNVWGDTNMGCNALHR